MHPGGSVAHIFLSHSSRDQDQAARMRDWLGSQGFDAVFLDFDKHAGIPPGADWERTLYSEIERSEAVILIQTPNWLESKWCFAEFTQARALGKAIFPVIEAPTGDTLIAPDIQSLDLCRDREGGLERLGRQLTRIALDAQGGFGWDHRRPPFPGLASFTEEDAAVYFGRDDEIRRLIERLNARRAQGGAKLVALLGASGSGKSSLLRAGVLPRLKRDRSNWIVLPAIRPHAQPLLEFACALSQAWDPTSDFRKLHEYLKGPYAARFLNQIAHELQVKESASQAQILLPIDQAEELFSTADPADTAAFFDVLTMALADDAPFLALMALRSDFLGELQSAGRLHVRFEEFSLGPFPPSRVPQIIQGPARVAGLQAEDAFVRQAAHDAETDDALPLLAFALRQLYDQSSADGNLTVQEYLALGDPRSGLSPLENAVRQAADGVLDALKPTPEEEKALRDAFIPAMVRVNDQGEYARRTAAWDDLPSQSRRLLDGLIRARLLVVQGSPKTVEVAHEALLRKWPRLRAWLDEAREFLIGKQQLESDLRDWQNAAPADKEGALLTGLKLSRMRAWMAERPGQLSPEMIAFGTASILRSETEQKRRLRQRRRIMQVSIAAAVLLAVAAALAFQQSRAAHRALQQLSAEMVRYAWIDIGHRQQELTFMANQLHRKVPDLVPTTAGEGDTPHLANGGFNCHTWLSSGFRYMYCSIRDIVGLARVQSLAGISVFLPGGPHGSEMNFENTREFGRYNPAFLSWLEDHVLPEKAEDPQSAAMIQLAYQDQIGPVVRALYHTHQILFPGKDAPDFQSSYADATRRYAEFINTQRRLHPGMGVEGYLDPRSRGPQPLESIKAEYLNSVQAGRPYDIGEAFRWLADYSAVVDADDWYLANTAGGFWVRRSADGTEPQIYRIVVKILRQYDPGVLQSPTIHTFDPASFHSPQQ
jgi:hypothetical protein